MSSKRSSLVTVSSLLRLCNGCYSRNIANFIEGRNTLRTIYQAGDSLSYHQNQDGFYQQDAGSVNEDFCQSNMKMQHKVDVVVNNSRGFNMHTNAFVEKHNWRQEYGQRMHGNQKRILTHKIGQFQQSPKYYCTKSSEMFGQCSSYGQTQQSPYNGTLEELDNFCMKGKVKEAVEVLQVLENLHIHVDLDLCLRLMRHCGNTKSLEKAKVVHRYVLQHSSPLKVRTCNIILEMYFECGSVDDAVMVFQNMLERDLAPWDTMVTHLTKNGCVEDSMDIFSRFKNMGLKSDGEIFFWVFVVFTMRGDIDRGMLHFESMRKYHGFVPTMEHYARVVYTVGSIGHPEEALEFIQKMSLESSVEVWEALMNSSRSHGITELEDRCVELVKKFRPSCLNEKSKAGLLPAETSGSS